MDVSEHKTVKNTLRQARSLFGICCVNVTFARKSVFPCVKDVPTRLDLRVHVVLWQCLVPPQHNDPRWISSSNCKYESTNGLLKQPSIAFSPGPFKLFITQRGTSKLNHRQVNDGKQNTVFFVCFSPPPRVFLRMVDEITVK